MTDTQVLREYQYISKYLRNERMKKPALCGLFYDRILTVKVVTLVAKVNYIKSGRNLLQIRQNKSAVFSMYRPISHPDC